MRRGGWPSLARRVVNCEVGRTLWPGVTNVDIRDTRLFSENTGFEFSDWSR